MPKFRNSVATLANWRKSKNGFATQTDHLAGQKNNGTMTRFKVNDRVRYTEQAARGMMNLRNQHNAVIPWDARVGTVAKVSSLSSSRVYVVWDGRKTLDQIEDRFLVLV